MAEQARYKNTCLKITRDMVQISNLIALGLQKLYHIYQNYVEILFLIAAIFSLYQ